MKAFGGAESKRPSTSGNRMVKRRSLRELGELIESETYILGVLATVVENSKNLDLLGLLDRAQRDIKVRMRGDGNAYHFGGCIKVLVVSEEGRGRKMVMMMRVRRKKEKQNIERPTPDIYAPGGHRSLVTTKSYNNVCNGERAAASRLVSVGSTDNPPQPRFHVSLRVVSVCVCTCAACILLTLLQCHPIETNGTDTVAVSTAPRISINAANPEAVGIWEGGGSVPLWH